MHITVRRGLRPSFNFICHHCAIILYSAVFILLIRIQDYLIHVNLLKLASSSDERRLSQTYVFVYRFLDTFLPTARTLQIPHDTTHLWIIIMNKLYIKQNNLKQCHGKYHRKRNVYFVQNVYGSSLQYLTPQKIATKVFTLKMYREIN